MSASCPRCGSAAAGGRFCGRCGAHLGPRAADDAGHGRRAAAGPGHGPGVRSPIRSRTAGVEGPDQDTAVPARPRPRGALLTVAAVVAVIAALTAVALGDGQRDPAGDPVELPESGPDEAGDPAASGTDAPTEPQPAPEFTCLSDAGCERWRIPLDGDLLVGLDVTDDGHLIVATGPFPDVPEVAAFGADGVEAWRRADLGRAGDDGPGRPRGIGAAGDLVVALSGADRITALEGTTGEVRWRSDGLGPADGHLPRLVATEVIGDTVLLHHHEPGMTGSDDADSAEGILLAVDAGTGEVRWSARADAATMDAGIVSTVTEGVLSRLDPATGDVRWTRTADWLDRGSPPSGPSAHVSHLDAGTLTALVTEGDGSPETLLIDGDTGEDRAVVEGLPVSSPGSPPLGQQPPLVVASPSPGAQLTAFDTRGEPQWTGSAELGRYCCATSGRLGDRLVIAGHDEPTPYAVLDVADGAVLHEGELEVDGPVRGLLGPGTLWVTGGEEATSVAVDAGDGRARWRAAQSTLVPALLEGLVLVVGPDGDLIAVDVA